MHLVINASEIGRRRGGNETYLLGLIWGLAALSSRPQVSLLTCRWDDFPPLPPSFPQLNVGPYRRLPFFLWQQALALRRLKADWYLSNFFLPPVLPCRGVVVVHDLSFRAYPDYFPRPVAWYMRWLTGLAVRQAHLVVTVSEFSRRELLRFYAVDERKVVSIHNGVGPEFRPARDEATGAADRAAIARYGVTPPYILAVGNIHPRKNLARLLEAYLTLRRRRADIPPLVWAGIERWGSDELLERARTAGVTLTGFIAQADLPSLYRQATMLVYPSLYEGFGLPPLEAMACGTPVITSNTTSLPEVVGEAALRVDPADTVAIASAIERLLDDSALRERLRQAGLERAALFTWEHTARRLVEQLR
ncbi:MAG: glycosyltransferase family 4 protein [Anaerolineae bacterium]|nr:glycosyltransferase family 4 protein [Anaerolineae bacterium]